MDDWMLMGIIAFFVMLGTLGISSAYYAYRCDELRKQCARRVEQANAEVVAAHKMVRRTEMQARVMGATPVSRLIGGDDE